ncbi:FAD-dependent oxidoreductase [Metabacillus idriensis]|uniref:dihydrolipoyl dehydrogenase family protein n=1 Tax=Metabacillus idriensis TaxID=324768 RepID=UPI002813E168|nr:FAD-dependent oxidoreductase [Metabacillus idriensis]MDR0137029.1 FAD-dependent oxidoreductase [Metabacillus idriensis]
MEEYDVIVIGGGAGGLTVAAGAASLGAHVALIERDENLGGDCLHVGCVPSKALISAANHVYEAKQTAASFGLSVSGDTDMKQIMNHVHQAIAAIQEQDDDERFTKLGIDVIHGTAAFQTKHEIKVGEQVIKGKKIVIATGSRPAVPDIEGLKDSRYLTNQTVFHLDRLPEKLAVIGGGPIGVELAQAFSRLGSEVTIIERSSMLLSKEDDEIRELATDLLGKEMTILTEASIESASAFEDRKELVISQDGVLKTLEVNEILLAAGRKPNSDKLNLNKIGVICDEKGFIKVNDSMQTSQSHIYAIGDVNGNYLFTHAAGMEGKAVVQKAVLGLPNKVKYDHMPWVTYTSPEVFHLGLTEKEAREAHKEIQVFKAPLNEVDRFIADGATDGFVKIITNTGGTILGAHAIGKGAGDWMQTVVFAKQNGKKIGDLSQMVYPYPNHAAAVQKTADLYWREKLFSGILPKLTEKWIKVKP